MSLIGLGFHHVIGANRISKKGKTKSAEKKIVGVYVTVALILLSEGYFAS